MKSDARLLLNKKKWKKTPGKSNADTWKSRSTMDARKILNMKRNQKSNAPVLGSYMRTKTATALIAERIKREISSTSNAANKRVQLSKDGNIIITSKSKNIPQKAPKKEAVKKFNFAAVSRNRSPPESMVCEPSTSMMDDLEHTAIEDVIDLESLPPSYVAPNYMQNANLSRNSAISQVLDKRYTMVADELSESSKSANNKVYASNLHPTVSRQDVLELFGDIGVIKGIEMSIPGSAIIEFFNEGHAIRACEIYHNRLLDGIPMKCYLHSGSTPQRFAMSQRLGSRNVAAAPPVQATSSPSLFNSRSRYNPRNVQFTVKLT